MVEYVQQWADIVDRTGWGEGPWEGEPDKAVWIDAATGFDCLAKRHPYGGNWCGYVGVPPGHPWHGADFGDLDVDVHGGLTFGDGCHEHEDPAWAICHVPQPGRPADVYWLGFDCHHGFDTAPGFEARMRALPDMPPMAADLFAGDTYRTLAYVVAECERLAAQVAKVE